MCAHHDVLPIDQRRVTMSSPAYFSFPRQWNAQDLANAVPRRLRLSQMVDFDAVREGAAACANAQGRKPRDMQGGYLRNVRSEEHTSELQSLMRISYAVFCLNKKKLLISI